MPLNNPHNHDRLDHDVDRSLFQVVEPRFRTNARIFHRHPLSPSLSLLPFPSLSHSDKLLSQDRGLQQKNVTQQNADCQYNWVTSLSGVKKNGISTLIYRSIAKGTTDPRHRVL